jgi:long-chain acyl-CoA synthetase
MLEQTATLGDLRRVLGLSPAASATIAESTAADGASFPAPATAAAAPRIAPVAGSALYPRWTWSPPIEALRVVFLEAILRPLVRLLAAPTVTRESKLAPAQPLLLIANHVSTYDMPLILYALPAPMRRHIAAAMAADILYDWRRRRNLGSWPVNQLGPLTYLLVTALFNVFPLPRGIGFRQSFQHAGEALDHGYNVLVFPEGHRSDTAELQSFRPGIGLLVAESKTAVLPIALAGLAGMKAGRRRWFRSGKLRVVLGSPLSFAPDTPPEEITERLHAEMARLLSLP